MARRQDLHLLQLELTRLWLWQLVVVLTWCHEAFFDGCVVGCLKKINFLFKHIYHRCTVWLIFTNWALLRNYHLYQEIEHYQHPIKLTPLCLLIAVVWVILPNHIWLTGFISTSGNPMYYSMERHSQFCAQFSSSSYVTFLISSCLVWDPFHSWRIPFYILAFLSYPFSFLLNKFQCEKYYT